MRNGDISIERNSMGLGETAVQPRPHTARSAVDSLVARYLAVRASTQDLARPLSAEDQQLQSMPLCSPTKWHRAHTTWFFETFILEPHGVSLCNPQFRVLFNSYYESVGPRHARPKRGLLSRPSMAEVESYRKLVDERMVHLLSSLDESGRHSLLPLLELGLAHEQQHQELMLTDILNAFHDNPLLPAYRSQPAPQSRQSAPQRPGGPMSWSSFPGGLYEVGVSSSSGFAFDNETPRHRVWLEPFRLSDRTVSVGEMKAFIDAGGYRSPSLWLSEGYDFVREHDIRAPLYWRTEGGQTLVFGLDGLREPQDEEPVCHVSYYEADAVARFLDARLPTEQEWEVAAKDCPTRGNFRESHALKPVTPSGGDGTISDLLGNVWEWTQSSYEPYPGYQPLEGALGEYNGKFMINQRVLRGGSCFTPADHMRPSYRNFWHPDTRFQVTGIRLAQDERVGHSAQKGSEHS